MENKRIRYELVILVLAFTTMFSCGKDDEPVTPPNNAPEISAQSFNASEAIDDVTIIGKVTATDVDNDELKFSIKTNSNDLFEITNTGDISLVAGEALDFETLTIHSLSIEVTDGSATTNAEITINIIDVDENKAPAFIAQTFSAQENTIGRGNLVAALVATDPDGDALTFSFANAANVSAFELNSGTGEISTVNSNEGDLDFETTPQYIIDVVASDGMLSTQAAITINVTDFNDFPVADNQTFSVSEDIDDSVLIGQIVATDQDGDPLEFSVDIDYDLLFSLSLTGEVRLRPNSELDYENTTSHRLDIFISDGIETITRTITVDVTDVLEPITGTVSTFAGTGMSGTTDGTTTNASFFFPTSLARDSQGNLYVADSDNGNVRKIDENNQVSTLNIGRPVNIGGLAVDANDKLYISDTQNHIILRWDPDDNSATRFAGVATSSGSNDSNVSGSGRFNFPRGMDFDSQGNLIVADANNYSIRKVSPSGFITTIAGSSLNSGSVNGTTANASFDEVSDIAIATDGTIYVADPFNNMIRAISSNNVVTTVAGFRQDGLVDGNGTQARFKSPQSLVIDENNNIYVTDTNNNTIRKITPNADVITLTQRFNDRGGDANGSLTNAFFSNPSGIEVDMSGNLYIGDGDNNQIRFIDFSSNRLKK